MRAITSHSQPECADTMMVTSVTISVVGSELGHHAKLDRGYLFRAPRKEQTCLGSVLKRVQCQRRPR